MNIKNMAFFCSNSGRVHTVDVPGRTTKKYHDMQDSTCVTAEQITVGEV